MNLFQVAASLTKLIFCTAKREGAERQPERPVLSGAAYQAEYEKQVRAYYRENGTVNGFEYVEPKP